MTKLEKDIIKLTKLLKKRRELDAEISFLKAIVAEQVREQQEILSEAMGVEEK